jgi:enterochelin esterase-like enzyme
MALLASLGAAPARAASGCHAQPGEAQRHTYDSAILGQPMTYSIYLPACYDGNTPLPVLYLLHGSNGDDQQWLRLELAAALEHGLRLGYLPPMVVVLPDGGWVANENRFDNRSWASVFMQELLPAVEARYHVRQDAAGRAIGGLSRGGFWAYHLGLRYPKVFGAVGGHSAFFDPANAPPDANPLNLAAAYDGQARLWLDRGRDDYAQYGLDLMSQRLVAAGIAHQYTVYPRGEHNADYWALHLPEYLAFYAESWHAPLPAAAAAPLPHTLLPIVAFNSPRLSLETSQLLAALAGARDPLLLLEPGIAGALRQAGYALHPGTRLGDPAEVDAALRANGLLYTLRPFAAPYAGGPPRALLLRQGDALFSALTWADYPLSAPAASRPYRLTFSGVTALARGVIPALDARGIAWAASGIEAYTRASDLFHMSNEVSFAPRCPQSDQPVLGGLCSKDEHFGLLGLLGADVIELTGNHNNDYNRDPYLRTLDFYRQAGMLTVGGGETLAQARQPLLLEAGGTTLGLLACNWNGPQIALATDAAQGAAFCERAWLAEAVPALAQQADVVIVLVQYAEYERLRPIERQVNDFRFLADLGADVVLGSQAHRPQIYELYQGAGGHTALLHYGLGNLFFDQTSLPNRQFLMDTLLLLDGRVAGVELLPGIIEEQARPRPMTAAEEARFGQEVLMETRFPAGP